MGQLTERVGFRPAALAGSIILLLGLELASLATAVWHLYLTYGLIVGIGCALAYIPALGVVPLWFRKHLGLAIGLSVSGGGIGGLILNPVIQAMLETVGFRWAFRILGFIAGGVGFVGAALLRSRGAPPPRKPGLKSLVDFSRFKDLTFARLYALAICSGMGCGFTTWHRCGFAMFTFFLPARLRAIRLSRTVRWLHRNLRKLRCSHYGHHKRVWRHRAHSNGLHRGSCGANELLDHQFLCRFLIDSRCLDECDFVWARFVFRAVVGCGVRSVRFPLWGQYRRNLWASGASESAGNALHRCG